MSDERMLPPDLAAKYRARLAEIRATMPHWGGGTNRPTAEAEAKLTANLGETLGKIMAGVSKADATTMVTPMRCHLCGAVERREGKRTVIEHDFSKHPQGEVPASQLDIKPVKRTREHDDDDRIFGAERTRETYNERLQAGRKPKMLGSGD